MHPSPSAECRAPAPAPASFWQVHLEAAGFFFLTVQMSLGSLLSLLSQLSLTVFGILRCSDGAVSWTPKSEESEVPVQEMINTALERSEAESRRELSHVASVGTRL